MEDLSKIFELVSQCGVLSGFEAILLVFLVRQIGKEREECERKNRENLALVERLMSFRNRRGT